MRMMRIDNYRHMAIPNLHVIHVPNMRFETE